MAGLWGAIGSGQFWRLLIGIALAVSVSIALLAFVFAAFVVVLPIVLAAGLGLHLWLRRMARRAPAPRSGPVIIEGEYTVVERR
jgi:hypothetical protein